MNRPTTQALIAITAMLVILVVAHGLDRLTLFLGELQGRTAMYAYETLGSFTLGHLVLAALLLGLFAWMVLRAQAAAWAGWVFLLVGLFISAYPLLYFTPVGRLLEVQGRLGLINLTGARSFFISAAAFIAITGAAALLRRRRSPLTAAQGGLTNAS